METAYISSPLGTIKIEGNHKGIASVEFTDEEVLVNNDIPDVLTDVVKELKEYFSNKRTEFSIKLAPKGTDFQKKVWKKLTAIPFGKTTSYQKMADSLGDPKVIRAAASANGKNPIAIIIPCHRVIGTDGSLTGYAGGLHRKKWLLEHENPSEQLTLF